ncbi:preprotein translocase subunit YajC [Ferroacidibacillus organovorans]|uniref:Preprotein translocase subunit YajC n=1 Tax=Ferroacidibacillus organovorans TaxID=1765683 RepID=A0A162TDI7_9BACL|nr:preprotein translocase subunit YajC [Ferroacidibacillus organovorans]KYP80697.1 preprotein translocase subunit YajC [Ferroacidibacillus organovorans]OAG93146.1 preprotein translocase subunit YajC [Ferroacidibacillus organovorans]OPG15937.1 preprotein translocase subunit YajC [Ferroacidibacillus organovorans]
MSVKQLEALIPYLFLLGILYVFILRPQQKRQKERNNLMSSLAVGSQVVTIGGLHGTVTAVEGQTVTIAVDGNTKLTFEKSAISRVVPQA